MFNLQLLFLFDSVSALWLTKLDFLLPFKTPSQCISRNNSVLCTCFSLSLFLLLWVFPKLTFVRVSSSRKNAFVSKPKRWHFFVQLCITNRISNCAGISVESKKNWTEKRGQQQIEQVRKCMKNSSSDDCGPKNWDPIYCTLLLLSVFSFFGFGTTYKKYAFCSNSLEQRRGDKP